MSTDFSNFLSQVGVFSSFQAEKFSKLESEPQDDALLFRLADHFKKLTPSDCYDMALRLHLLWKKGVKVVDKDTTYLQPILKSPTNKLNRMMNGENKARQDSRSKSQKKRTISFSLRDDDEESSIQQNNVSIFERLYSESSQKHLNKIKNEELKAQNELRHCTFKPVPSVSLASTPSVDQSLESTKTNVFTRLQRDHRKEREEINKNIKDQKEVEGCTFQPILSNRQSSIDSSNILSPKKNDIDSTFNRLYTEYNYKRQQRIENELKKQTSETKDCTFKPSLNTSRISDRGDSALDRSTELYQLHTQKKQNIIRRQLEKFDHELDDCTFSPNILSPRSVRSQVASPKAHERLLEWEKDRKKKLEEKVRDKEREETSRELLINRKPEHRRSKSRENAFDRLYKHGENKKHRLESLEKKVLNDIGASFTPKTNPRKEFSNNSSSNTARVFSNITNISKDPRLMVETSKFPDGRESNMSNRSHFEKRENGDSKSRSSFSRNDDPNSGAFGMKSLTFGKDKFSHPPSYFNARRVNNGYDQDMNYSREDM